MAVFNSESSTPMMQQHSEDRLEFLSRVASMYYEQGLTQQSISAELGYSRSAISRFLTEAREAGIVEIRVHHPLERNTSLEHQLREAFKVRDARVLMRNTLTYQQMLSRLGALGARIIEQVVRDGTYLGVSWGTAVYEVANALRPRHCPNVRVVQIIGSLSTYDPHIDGPELARWFARLYGGTYQLMPAPLIVDNEATRTALVNDRKVRETLDQIEALSVAVVGIGTTDLEKSSLVRAGYLSQQEVTAIAAEGAVGDVCGLHFNAEGRVLDIPISRRVVGISPEALRSIPIVIGVAGGEAKVEAVRGALRSGLINTLVTDDLTVQRVLEQSDEAG